MQKFILTLFASVAILMTACHSKQENPQPSTVITKENARWYFDDTKLAVKPTVQVSNKQLILGTNAHKLESEITGASINYAESLKGDFEIRFSIDSLSTTSDTTQPILGSTLLDSLFEGPAVSLIGDEFIIHFNGTGTVPAEQSALATISSFDIVYKRTGNAITASILNKKGDIVLTSTHTNLGNKLCFINLTVDGDGATTEIVKGYISNFKITGGASKYGGDDFAENRVFVGK